jgi:beta-lactamase superfamily II metal-dependent hydrolase
MNPRINKELQDALTILVHLLIVKKITAVNQVSIIWKSQLKKKYLFTGDASPESFPSLPGYTVSFSDIYWLKVAHHESHNNASSALFSESSLLYC